MGRVLTLLAIVCLVPLFVPAHAQTGAGERVALVIGNAAYKEARLANPVNDATDVAAALRGLGFRVISRTNANQRDMKNAVREFGAELRRAQVGLFYFAGHGVQVKGNNYLVPVGADIASEADAEDLSVDANFVLRTMEDSQVKVSIAILDACRNNPFARSFRSASRGLAQMTAATGSLVAFSTAPGSVAADGTGRNGIYTKHLLASLRQPDADILRVFQRTRAGVVKETGGRQTPWESTSLVGDFYFRGGATVAATQPLPGRSSEQIFWESVKDSGDAEEFRAYLRRFPQGEFADLAQNRLNRLQGGAGTQIAALKPPAPVVPAPALGGDLAGMAPGTVFRDCAECPELVVIPAGSFVMGSPADEQGRYDDEGPQHRVTIARAFAAGKFEVTFDEWDGCVRAGGCSHSPSDEGWGRGRRPVTNVSWQDAKQYAEWLSRKTGKSYRLLTEAEWEYAARAGTTTAFSTGPTNNPTQANYDATQAYAGSVTGPYRRQTVPVGSFGANAFGLHDVHGNVWEWTEDCRNASYNGAPSDGSAWTSGDCARRVLRGGSWVSDPRDLRSAFRSYFPTSFRVVGIGLRVARTN